MPVDLTTELQHIEADPTTHLRSRCDQLQRNAGQILARMRDLFGDFTNPCETPLAFSRHRTLGKGTVAVVKEGTDAAAGQLWFIGDIHGDLLALDAAVAYIDKQSPNATIVFLGDLFDREGYGYEVLLRVFKLIIDRPSRIGFVVGNHDVALQYRHEAGTFWSLVSPADFVEFLNSNENPLVREVGQFAVDFFAAAPRAIFLPDGLIVTHGGVPLGSRTPGLKQRGDLESQECLQDFVWTRAHERARKKIPNPTSKTSEFGFEDFSAFCDVATNVLGIPAKRIIRGHDHYEAGHSIYERWTRNQCVTINTLSRRLDGDSFGPFERTPCVARWYPDTAPEIHQLTIPASIIRAYYQQSEPVRTTSDA